MFFTELDYFAGQLRHSWLKIDLKGGSKLAQFLYALLTDFQKYFTVRIRRKLEIVQSLKIPSHLKCVATLPSEMSGVLKATTLYAFTSSNVYRFSKFYLLILMPMPSDVITDVTGIWSVFLESFVCL